MDLLEFAKGPALQAAAVIFVLGVVWRLLPLFLMRRHRNLSEPRNTGIKPWLGALRVMGDRSYPHPEFIKRTGYSEALSYTWHLGIVVIFLLTIPHILFIESLIGLRWPGIPGAVSYIVSVVTLAALLATLIRRVTHSVTRRLSNADDYISWFVTTLVIVTGLMASGQIGGSYQTLLGVHILSFDLLLIWFPFGKLMHAFYIFPSRAVTGYIETKRGASA